MGKFDYKDMGTEEEIVSVWVAKCNPIDIPDDYLDENYGEDDDEEFNQFSADFKIGYYDHDFFEPVGLMGVLSLEEILKTASYGSSFSKQVAEISSIKESEYILLMFNMKYDPEITQVTENKYFKYIGNFKYSSD